MKYFTLSSFVIFSSLIFLITIPSFNLFCDQLLVGLSFHPYYPFSHLSLISIQFCSNLLYTQQQLTIYMNTEQLTAPNLRKLNLKKLKESLKEDRSILRTKPTEDSTYRLNSFSPNNRQIKLKLKPLPNYHKITKLPSSEKLRELKSSVRNYSEGKFVQYDNKIRKVKTEHLEKDLTPLNLKQLKQMQINEKKEMSFSANLREKPLMNMSTHENFRIRKNQESFHKGRSKSEQINKALSRQERVNKFEEQRLRIPKNRKKQLRYKNEKLNIIIQDYHKILKNIPEHLVNQTQFQKDILCLIEHFKNLSINASSISRQVSENMKTFLGKLLFFIGYEIYMRYSEDQTEHRDHEVSLSNFYHIYFAFRLKIPLLVLESYLVLIDEALQQCEYSKAQQYSEKCLLASIYYGQKFYEFRCVEKLSMCEYYRGNICQATYLHDNNGNITQESIRKVKDGFNEQEQLDIIFHHIYEVPRFDVKQILADYDSRLQNYKALIIFNNPRIEPKQSMRNKKQQLKVDLIKMERIKEFKTPVQIMKKEFKLHESLFTVQKQGDSQPRFKLIKRNLAINEQNESSQILRAHQSLNRIKVVNKKPIKRKLAFQFMQFLRDILAYKY